MNRQRGRNSLTNTFKDYLVPIVGCFLLIIILYSIFSGDDTATVNEVSNENRVGYSTVFGDLETEAFIEYETGKKEKIENGSEIFKGEKLLLKSGNASLKIGNTNFNIDKLGEFKINTDGSYSLFSSNTWVTSDSDTLINMRYGKVSSSGKSVFSLSQNEVGSSIYVLQWTVEVSNLWGQSTLLWKGQKITIPRSDASSEDIDMSLLKSEIDTYFLGSDWFLENGGPSIVSQNTPVQTGSGIISGAWYISFEWLRDEMRISESTLNISGNVLDDSIKKVSINNTDVSIDDITKEFTLENLRLPQSVNDIVVKLFDIDGQILEKLVYTVYTSASASSSDITIPSPIGTSSTSGWATYQADATQFGFTAPSATGKFSTTGSEITIRGITTADNIGKVEVNGFELSSFNGSTWRYHAFSRFETLALGTNQYKIDYFDTDGNVVYTDYYTIVKKEASASPVQVATPTAVESDIPTVTPVSDEADPQ